MDAIRAGVPAISVETDGWYYRARCWGCRWTGEWCMPRSVALDDGEGHICRPADASVMYGTEGACPTCDGRGHLGGEVDFDSGRYDIDRECPTCHGTAAPPR